VPYRYKDETWRTLLESVSITNAKRILSTAKALKGGDVAADWCIVHGRPKSARMLAGALMLRSACDGELDGMLLDVPKLIDAEFQPGRGADVYRLPVLVVQVGNEPANRYNSVVMDKLIHQRWEASLFTMLLVEGEPARVAASYKSASLATAIQEQFFKSCISQKEDE
jgi:hypothetical protein